MPTQDVFDDQEIDGPQAVLGPVDAREEDEFWKEAYRREHYYSAELEYEDYAPAYCVGYIGYAQYGGAYDDAETSLCANWERIRSDSRLTLEEARLAMRAAWDRMAARGMAESARKVIGAGWWRSARERVPSGSSARHCADPRPSRRPLPDQPPPAAASSRSTSAH